MIGIPYARVALDANGIVRICPVCGARIRETTDQCGEQRTNHYAEHYAAEHSEAA